MPAVATHADALRFSLGGTEMPSLAAVGVLDGVRVLAAAGANGPGMGRLIATADGDRIAWQAPGSDTAGDAIQAAADGSYLLEDGEDAAKWLRVQVYSTYRPEGSGAARVYLGDAFNNALAGADVSAGEASAGDVFPWTIILTNAGLATLSQLKIWLDAAVTRIAIADDGATWVTPTTEAAALALPDLVPGGTDTLHIRRTVAASTPFDPSELVHLHYSFQGL